MVVVGAPHVKRPSHLAPTYRSSVLQVNSSTPKNSPYLPLKEGSGSGVDIGGITYMRLEDALAKRQAERARAFQDSTISSRSSFGNFPPSSIQNVRNSIVFAPRSSIDSVEMRTPKNGPGYISASDTALAKRKKEQSNFDTLLSTPRGSRPQKAVVPDFNGSIGLFSGSFSNRQSTRETLNDARAASAKAMKEERKQNNRTGPSSGAPAGDGHSKPSGGDTGGEGSGGLRYPSINPPPPSNPPGNGKPNKNLDPSYECHVVLSSGKSTTKPIELMAGLGSTQGLRPTMEDEHFCALKSATVRNQPVSFLGILDGHCGRRVAELAAKGLPSFFFANKALGDNNALALVETILQVDQNIYQVLSGKSKDAKRSSTDFSPDSRRTIGYGNNTFTDGPPSGGSTLICAAVHGRMLYVACLGDARAVLLDGNTTIAMSEDHKPQNPNETDRIQRCGGFVQFGRVCGVLAVSRAMGDFEFKGSGFPNSGRDPLHDNKGGKKQELMVSNVADIRQLVLTDESKFLILACDGLWDVISNEEATQFVQDFLLYTPEVNDVLALQGKRPRPTAALIQRVLNNCCQKLADFAVQRGSTDNVSVELLFFHDVLETIVGFSQMPPLVNVANSSAADMKNFSTPNRRSPKASVINKRRGQFTTGSQDANARLGSANVGYVLPQARSR